MVKESSLKRNVIVGVSPTMYRRSVHDTLTLGEFSVADSDESAPSL